MPMSQRKDGAIVLSEPVAITIPKPAGKELPKGNGEEWLAQIDELAREADRDGAHPDPNVACYFYAAGFRECRESLGPVALDTLFFQQALCSSCFDNGRIDDTMKLSSDILKQCRKVKAEGNFDEYFDDLVENLVGCLCKHANNLSRKREYSESMRIYDQAHKAASRFLSSKILIDNVKANLDKMREKVDEERREAEKERTNADEARKAAYVKQNEKALVCETSEPTNDPSQKTLGSTGIAKPEYMNEISSETRNTTTSQPADVLLESGLQPVHDLPGKDKKERGNRRGEHGGQTKVLDESKASLLASLPSLQKTKELNLISPTNPNAKGSKDEKLQVQSEESSKKQRSRSTGGETRCFDVQKPSTPLGDLPRPRSASQADINTPIVVGSLFDSAIADGKPIRLARWSSGDLKRTQDFIKACRGQLKYSDSRRPKRRVRIAVLDTGIDTSHPSIETDAYRKERLKGFLCEINGLKDDPDNARKDSHGHGTHVTRLLMRIAPEADIYVARVFKEQGNVESAYVASAIRHAVDHWEVDIISMSFGFPSWVADIDRALNYAHNNDVLLFAAAANDGANTTIPEAWPARDHIVFSIHATHQNGSNWAQNPSTDRTDNWATLGVDVSLDETEGDTQAITGTSIATPIAAGMAAMLIEFTRQADVRYKSSKKFRLLQRAQTFHGMQTLFRASSQYMVAHRYFYLKPWHLFSTNFYEEERICYDIDRQLRSYFG